MSATRAIFMANVQSGKSSLMNGPDVKLIPQTNKQNKQTGLNVILFLFYILQSPL